MLVALACTLRARRAGTVSLQCDALVLGQLSVRKFRVWILEGLAALFLEDLFDTHLVPALVAKTEPREALWVGLLERFTTRNEALVLVAIQACTEIIFLLRREPELLQQDALLLAL